MVDSKRINASGMGTSLPIPIIQHIQSFLTGKEAARSSVLSKSWYSAWLTRPDLILNQRSFLSSTDFDEFVAKTMGRYEESNINIYRFKLRVDYFHLKSEISDADELIKKALKLCVDGTNCKFQFRCKDYVLPSEVLGSEMIVRLSVSGCKICRPPDGRVECSKLKSLCLDHMKIDDDEFFSDTFPCLEDLTLLCCYGYTQLKISGTSLKWITIVESRDFKGNFNVPNIRKFIFSGSSFPTLSLAQASGDWESEISVNHLHRVACEAWFLRLKVLLRRLIKSMCKVSINVGFYGHDCDFCCGYLSVLDIPEVENLAFSLSSEFLGYDGLLGSLFMNCHPKFITQYWFPKPCVEGKADNEFIKFLCKRLIKDRQRNEYGYDYLHGLEDVKVEIFEEILDEWIALPWMTLFNGSEGPENKEKIRFQLEWD